jgi:3-hydroxyisobutyrate dehydrogenase-like beta-hydroxyacid dehydrogenase
MRVGFIGAGRMGRPMVGRLLAAGHEVTVLGRSPQAREGLVAQGARVAAQAAAVAEKADVACVCVFSDEQVRQLCLADGLIAALPEGAGLVIHTTGSPRTALQIAAAGARRGIAVIDSPVSGGPHDIAAGRITLLVGGAEADVERVRPLLRAYGDPILHVGPLGAGQAVKLVNNALFAANIGLVAQAVRLGEQLGVPEEGLLAALPHGSAASRGLTVVAGRGSVATSARMLAEFLGKDVSVVREVAAGLGASLGVLDAAIGELEKHTADQAGADHG